MAEDKYTPKPEHKFTFGLWTVGNRGRDPFGDAVRPTLAPNDAVRMLAEVGAWGVNFHDNDLVPIDAAAQERDRIVREFRAVCEETGLTVPMATVNLFYDPVFRDGAFTANDARVRAYAVQKTMRAMDLGAELGAGVFVLWGGREGRSGGWLGSRNAAAPAAPRHFDSHAYRTEDYEGVKEFARGSMRTYLILKEKAAQWNADPEIKAILAEIAARDG